MTKTSPTAKTPSLSTAVTALRQVGFARIVLGFFVAQVVLIFAADLILGPNGLDVLPDAGGVGAGFGCIWAYIAFQRLGRAQSPSQAIAGAFRPALLITCAALGLMIVRRRF
jgi:hypothetical protein